MGKMNNNLGLIKFMKENTFMKTRRDKKPQSTPENSVRRVLNLKLNT